MPLQIIRNDITKVAADAIVNTANLEPTIGGGTDYAIHKAAGPELLEARKEIGEIGVGRSVATPAFQLSAKYVLHTVSPVWIDGQHHEEELLRKAYDSALHLADELECKSVAFPLLSAGTYGFPRDRALAVAIQTFTDFLVDHEMLICLVLFNAKAFGIAGSIFDDLKSYIDDNYVRERNEEEYLIDAAIRPSIAANRPPRSEYRRRRWWRREEKERPEPDLFEVPDEDQGKSDLFEAPANDKAQAEPDLLECMPLELPCEMQATVPSSLADFLDQHEKTFSEYLLDLLRERDGKDSEVYKRAEVSKQLFSKILSNKDYQPTKTTVIQLALGLQLDLAQTQKLLGKAGYTLTRSSKTDLVVQYYIERKIYNVTFINTALDDCGLPLLKTGLKS